MDLSRRPKPPIDKRPGAGSSPAHPFARLAGGDTLHLLATDSGLGGLAVIAEIERRARASGRYRELTLDFYSALGETGQGYNKMPSHARQLAVFDDALAGMLRESSPDLLLVACNTLSVLIPESRVLATSPVPVVGIVELGVEAIAERLAADPQAVVAIFATETTIASGAHRQGLIARGVVPEKIVPIPCPGLASRIELEGRSDAVAAEIGRFAGSAVELAGGSGASLVAALGCTHYGYCAEEFAVALCRAGAARVEIVDPNLRMAALLDPPGRFLRHASPRVDVRVVSRAVPLPGEVSSIAALLEPISPQTAAALRGYELRRGLFPFTGLAG